MIDERLVADVDLLALCSTVGTGMTTANSFGSPLKSFAIVMTVRSPSRTSTTCDALLNSFVSALAT